MRAPEITLQVRTRVRHPVATKLRERLGLLLIKQGIRLHKRKLDIEVTSE